MPQKSQVCIKLTGPRAVPARSGHHGSRRFWYFEPLGMFLRAAGRDGSRSDPEFETAQLRSSGCRRLLFIGCCQTGKPKGREGTSTSCRAADGGLDWVEVPRSEAGGDEIRIPKPEIRRKSEARNPNEDWADGLRSCWERCRFGSRISAFGFRVSGLCRNRRATYHRETSACFKVRN
jgi:hypothetical protein